MEDVEHETFLSMLEYIYTGEVSCSPVVTVDLLKCKYAFFNAIIILLYYSGRYVWHGGSQGDMHVTHS